MKFPKHHQLCITHNGHFINYETIAQYIEGCDYLNNMDKKDVQKCIETNQIWEIQWYPYTPISFYSVAASTLERCLEIINSQIWD